MVSSSTALSILTLFSSSSAMAQVFTREDGKCGLVGGVEAGCEHIPPFPTCCQENGHCGWDCDGIPIIQDPSKPASAQPPPTPVAAAPSPQQTFVSNGRYRSDGRCGGQFPLDDGKAAECDPNSQYFCCSEKGWCGGTQEHCFCDTCTNYRPLKVKNNVRSDRRCGDQYPLEDGSTSECDGQSANHCCSTHGYCGPAPDHCDCVGCVDYRGGGAPRVNPLLVGRVRQDRRCGAQFPLTDGLPSECNGTGENPCCSKWGYCGPGADHCECEGCADYRTADQKAVDFVGKVRKDRRCGSSFPLPGTNEPSECDGNSEKFCCSKWGYCGGDDDHCGCPECVNYKGL